MENEETGTNPMPADAALATREPSKPESVLAALAAEDLTIPDDVSSDAIALPLEEVSKLGAKFSSLAVKQNSSLTYLQAVDSAGRTIPVTELAEASDGLGFRGFIQDAGGKITEQAHFEQVAPVIDPSTALMAFALMSVNRKIDGVQKSVDKLARDFDLKQQADMRSALQELMNDARDYTFNSGNEHFRHKALQASRNTRELAGSRILYLGAQLERELAESQKRVHTRGAVDKRTGEMANRLGEYQLSVQAYNAAGFFEVVLQESFEPEYLAEVKKRLRKVDAAYRNLYSRCYEALEEFEGSSVEARVSGVGVGAAKGLGGFVSKTPVGKHTGVDDALEDLGETWETKAEATRDALLGKLREVKSTGVAGYIRSIDELDAVHNQPVALLADKDNLYLLPIDGDGELATGSGTAGRFRLFVRHVLRSVRAALQRVLNRMRLFGARKTE